MTLTVTAKAQAVLGTVMSDECEATLTAKLVFAPNPETGRYDEPSEENYTFTASGNGHILDIESWTYSALQAPSGMVSLSYQPTKGRAVVGWGYLDDYIRSTPEAGQGSERMARTMIKIADDNLGQDPESGVVHFEPGAASFTASGSSKGTHQDMFGQGEMTATYTVSRGGEQVEAVILKPRGYESWLPIAGPDQTLPGTNPVVVVAELRLKGTPAPPPVRRARFRFELVDVSKEPGLCLNSPPKEEAGDDFDLGLAKPGGITPGGSPPQSYETENLGTSAMAVVFAYDHGAFGRVRVTAITDTGEEIPAHVEGDPDRKTLNLPKDDNHNRIADTWEQDEGIWGEVTDAKWDESNEPDDHEVNGDGIGLYEKYRGFMFAGEHERLKARRKHVFVYDADGLVHANLGSVMNFEAASHLRVRFVEDETWTGSGPAGSDKRVVNFNTSGHGHAVDQHALHVRMVNSKTPTLADDFQTMWKAKYGEALDRDISTYYGFTYHDVTGGDWADAPRSAFAIELYPWGTERISREYVRYHTFALPEFKDYDTATPDEQTRLLKELDKLTDEHIAAKSNDWEDQNFLYLMAGTSHELGHGVGIDDLQAPHNGGPWSCFLRYLDWDFPPNTSDRMEIKARWHHAANRPQEFCHNPAATNPGKGCYEQIHVTDRRAKGAARHGATERSPVSSGGEPASPGPRAPGAPDRPRRGPSPAADPPSALGITAELDWTAPFTGDPLRFTIRLTSPAVMRTWTRALLDDGANPTPPEFPAIAANWPDGLRLELSRIEAGGARTVVQPSGAWETFRRAAPADPGLWERRLGARTREFLTDPAAVNLAPGAHVLSVAWNGRGLVDDTLLPASGLVSGSELHFTVAPPTDDAGRAGHLRRLAFQTWDRGLLETARQWGREALSLAPGDAGREAVDNAFVVAVASLGLKDPLGAAQGLQAFGGRQGEGASPETRLQAHRFLNALAPSLRMERAPAPGFPERLQVLGHPGHTYEVQVSTDLMTWTQLDRRLTTTVPYEVVDPGTAVGGPPRFYRVLWLP